MHQDNTLWQFNQTGGKRPVTFVAYSSLFHLGTRVDSTPNVTALDLVDPAVQLVIPEPVDARPKAKGPRDGPSILFLLFRAKTGECDGPLARAQQGLPDFSPEYRCMLARKSTATPSAGSDDVDASPALPSSGRGLARLAIRKVTIKREPAVCLSTWR